MATLTRSVLLVEDHADLCFVFGVVLRNAGHVLHIAKTKDEATTALHSFQPDVVILDLWLGAECGFEILKAIHSGKGLDERPKVIGISGIPLELARRQARFPEEAEIDFDQFLLKPIDGDALLQAIREVESVSHPSSSFG